MVKSWHPAVEWWHFPPRSYGPDSLIGARLKVEWNWAKGLKYHVVVVVNVVW